jgi:hypothetical protein
MRRPAGVAFTAGLLGAALLLLGLTLGLDPGSRLIPLSVALPLTLLLSVQLVRDIGRAADVSISPAERAAAGWVAVLAGLILLAGLLPGVALFVAVYLRRQGRETWPVTIGAGSAAAILYGLVITRALGAAFPQGLLVRLLASGANG